MSTLNSYLSYRSRYDHITIKFKAKLTKFVRGEEATISISYWGLSTLSIIGYRRDRHTQVPIDATDAWVRSRCEGLLKQFKSQGWTVTEANFTQKN